MIPEQKNPYAIPMDPQAYLRVQSLCEAKSDIDLEIGIGRPHFLFERAISFPTRHQIGLEWKERWVTMANKKAARDSNQAVLAIHANAWDAVPELFGPSTLTTVSVNFPDPWWKARHMKRRVLNSEFISVLAEKLKIGGQLFIQTDVSDLFKSYVEIVGANNSFHVIYISNSGFEESPMQATSHREKKCLKLGIPVFRAVFERRL